MVTSPALELWRAYHPTKVSGRERPNRLTLSEPCSAVLVMFLLVFPVRTVTGYGHDHSKRVQTTAIASGMMWQQGMVAWWHGGMVVEDMGYP